MATPAFAPFGDEVAAAVVRVLAPAGDDETALTEGMIVLALPIGRQLKSYDVLAALFVRCGPSARVRPDKSFEFIATAMPQRLGSSDR